LFILPARFTGTVYISRLNESGYRPASHLLRKKTQNFCTIGTDIGKDSQIIEREENIIKRFDKDATRILT
jgi:hypothetical protein